MYLFWAKQLHLSGTLWPLIIPMAFGDAFSIFLLRQFLLTDPAGVHRRGQGRRLRRPAERCCGSCCRWPGRRSRRSRCSSSSTAGTTTSGRRSTPARTPAAWTLSYGLAVVQERPPHQLEPHHGRDAAGHGAGDHRVLLRPEGLHRGRHADRSEGYEDSPSSAAGRRTRRSWSTASPGCGTRCRSTSWSCRPGRGPARARRRRSAARILAPAGPPGAAHARPPTSTPGVDGADAVLLQLRVGGQAARDAGRDLAAGVRLRRAGDHRRGRAGQGAAHGAGRARHRRAGARRPAPDAWIVDFTNPVGIVTRALLQAGHRAVGLCNVAIGFQRRFAGAARASTPDAVRLDHVGLNHLTWERRGAASTAWTVLPGAARPSTATRSPTTLELPRGAAAPARRGAVVLPALLLRPRRGGRASCGPRRRGPPRWPRSSGSCWRCTPTRRWTRSPRCWRSAAARSTPRPPSAWCASLLGGDRRRRAGGQRAQRRHPAVPARRRGRSRCRRRSAPRAPTPLPVAPLEPLYAGLVAARHGVRAPGARGGAARRPGPGLRGAAGAPAGRPGRPRRRS